jgi:hypothetical protein
MRLAWCEPNFLKIIHHPLFRLLEPVALLFVKPAIRWTDVIPFWLRKAKNLKP